MATRATLPRPALRRLVRPYLEIVVAAVAGMLVLGPVAPRLLNPIGWAQLLAHTETSTLVMATNVDRTSGADRPAIDWSLTVGDRIKLRLVNEMFSFNVTRPPEGVHP